MEVRFVLTGKGFSINAAYYATRKIKTAAAREWEAAISEQLNDIKLLADLALEWNKLGGTFEVEMIHEYPYHVFYNKQGQVSSKTFDCSNVEKLLLDQIFGGALDINDKYVTKLISEKRVGPQHQIKVRIQLL